MDNEMSDLNTGVQESTVLMNEGPVITDQKSGQQKGDACSAELMPDDKDIEGTDNNLFTDYNTDEDSEHEDEDSETTRSLVVIPEDPIVFDSYESSVESSDEISDTSDKTSSVDNDDTMNSAENESLYYELESRILEFEGRLENLQVKMDDALDSNGNLLSSIGNDLETRADKTELKRLKRDFEQLSKKLRRVVQAEDSVTAEALDATKVPSDVLEITYAKTLNDLYSAMLEVYGDRESSEMVEDARENVRQFSAGVDFFRFEEGIFVVRELSDAIASKIVSIKQIHGTYVELFKMLVQYVPNYNSQDFRAFVETGSREYTIEKVVSHEKHIDDILDDIETFRDEISNITENVSFIAELQNNQIEDMEGKFKELSDVKEQMKSIAKAVNLHTKALTKLNKTLKELRDSPLPQFAVSENAVESADLTKIEEMVGSKASREEIMLISGEMQSFKANVESMFASIQQQLEQNMLNSRKVYDARDEVSDVSQELQSMPAAEEPALEEPAVEIPVLEEPAVEMPVLEEPAVEMPVLEEPTVELPVLEEPAVEMPVLEEPAVEMPVLEEPAVEMPVLEEPQAFKPVDMPIEDVIISQLSILGSATLKQLEKHMNNEGFPMEFEKLSLVMSYLEQGNLVSSTKKGRYAFYSVADPVNV